MEIVIGLLHNSFIQGMIVISALTVVGCVARAWMNGWR